MSKIKKITPQTLHTVEQHIADALKGLGLHVVTSRGQYCRNQMEGNFRVEFAVEGHDPNQIQWEQCAEMYGLKASDFGREFTSQRKRFRITGVNLQAPKYPINAKCLDDGKSYKFPEGAVKMALHLEDRKEAEEVES